MESGGGGVEGLTPFPLKGMYFQIRNHPEMALVAGLQSVAEVKRGSADQQIGR